MFKPSMVAVFAMVLVVAFEVSRADYNVATSFSPTSNPNGVWTYGWRQTIGSTLVQDVTHTDSSGVDFWEGTVGGANAFDYPYVAHNGTGQSMTFDSTVSVAAGQFWMHPGPDDEYSDVRFTAPTTAIYSIVSSLSGIDTSGTTTDVHIFLDGGSLFSSAINGFGSTVPFSSTRLLSAGDTVAFEVGFGSNGSYFDDSTGLSADISAVPEPGNFTIMAAALLGLSRLDKRRSKVSQPD